LRERGGVVAGEALGPCATLDPVQVTGTVYVSGRTSHDVFRILSGDIPVQILDSTGGGFGLANPTTLAVDASNNLFVAGTGSDNVLKRTPAGVVTQIIDADADGSGPYVYGRDIDLSRAAARAIGVIRAGAAAVRIEVVVDGGPVRRAERRSHARRAAG
jgi:hypothetical protein